MLPGGTDAPVTRAPLPDVLVFALAVLIFTQK